MTDTYDAIGQKFTEEFLSQHGVKGMRWGVRRSDAALEKAAKKREGGDSEKKSNAAPKGTVVGKTNTGSKKAGNMSDAELQKVINRINMEQNYARLTAPPPTTTQKLLGTGSKLLSEVALSVAKTQMSKIANEKVSSTIGDVMGGRPKSPNAPSLPRLVTPPDPTKRVTG